MARTLQYYINMTNEFRNKILSQAAKLKYIVSDLAPSVESDLFNTPSLKIWAGESNNTIWGDASVNHAFRALHDALHLKTGMGFSIDEEIELGRIQAAQYEGKLADLVYIEVAEQAKYYKQHGVFVPNQVVFTMEQFKKVA